MLRAFEIRLYPNSGQRKYLEKIFGSYRKVYNLCLEHSINHHKETNKYVSSLSKLSNYFHKVLLKDSQYDYLTEHNTKILKDSISNLSKAYSNYFNKINPDTGLPNFKKKDGEQSIGLYSEAFSKKVFYINNFMFISKHFGNIKYKTSKEYKEILNKYKDCIERITVTKRVDGTYYASVLIDYKETKVKEETTNCIGIDLGIKDFLITTDNDKLENKNKQFNKKVSKQKKRLQRKQSRQQLVNTDKKYYNEKYKKEVTIKRRSNNREKTRLKLAKLNTKINNKKDNYLHEVTNHLINNNQVIAMESLDVKEMLKNTVLAKFIQEVNFGKFKETLKYKSLFYGRDFVQVDKYFPSSKQCSSCNTIKKDLKLSDRVWICELCGVEHDRDINAANNILSEGLKILIGRRYPESTLVELNDNLTVNKLKNYYLSMKQEENRSNSIELNTFRIG